MSQLTIVTTPQNSGLGTPLATAFNYCNSNFGELYARAQTTPPATLVGQSGDVAGMYAYDSTYFYYCFANYDGSSTIWAQVTQVGNVSLAEIQSGTSNVAVVGPGSNVAVGIGGTSNVAVFATTGVYTKGILSATGNIRGSYIIGNGSQLTGLPAGYSDSNVTTLLSNFGSNVIISTGNISSGNLIALGQISASGNITGAYIIGNGSQLTGLPASYTNANVVTLLANFNSNVISSTSNITGGNLLSTGVVSATGNIITSGYIIGDVIGNVIATISNIPGPAGAVLFNDGTGNVAATAGLVFNNSGPNVLTVLGSVSATANIIGNVVTASYIVGNLTTSAQPNVTSVGTLTSLSVSGNITGGNLSTGGNVSGVTLTGTSVSASGNVTGANIVGGAVVGSSLSVSGNVTANNISGILSTAAQPNLTSVGTLSSLSVTANVQSGNLRTAGQISATGNIRGGNISILDVEAGGNISATNYTGTAISVVGNITGANIFTGGAVSATGNISGNYFLGNIAYANGLPTVYGNSNVVSLMAAFGSNAISTFGNVNAGTISSVGDIISAATVSATGNIIASGDIIGSLTSTVRIQSTTTATGANTGALQVQGGASIMQDLWVIGNVFAGNITGTVSNVITVQDPLLYLQPGGNVTYPYNYDIGFYSAFTGGTGNTYQHTGLVRDFNDNVWKLASNLAEPVLNTLTFDANTIYDALLSGPITSTGSISAAGNITGGNLSVGTGTVTVGSIVNANANSVGNIGSSSKYFNTVFAKATSAQYADLAENYVSDSDYPPGTVVVFGGEKEITVTNETGDERVAGVISENPAHLMNSGMPGLAVALRGRVPVRVIGPVIKGDSLITSNTAGAAVSVGRNRDYAQAVFAKAIETDLENGEKTITAVIL